MSKAVLVTEVNKDIGGITDLTISNNNEKKESPIGIFSRFLRLDALGSKKNVAPENPPSLEPPLTYYGVYIPCEIKKGSDEEALHVYKNKLEALELVRRYKLARFKAFQSHQEAVEFALRGAEPVDVPDGNDNSVMGEKPYPFKAPSPQEMVSLRKAIEAGSIGIVCDRVWDNPRYLVSSGNTPAILQEGSRYNALHVAAKAKNAEIANLILTTVGNPDFVQKLYGSDADEECCKEFAEILLDRYLNTPDKAMNETPLHFASKFAAEDVIDVLTSFSQCNRNAVNKFGEQAKDIVGTRNASCSPTRVKRTRALLAARFYVPVLRCPHLGLAPALGLPFSPAEPPALNADALSPRREMCAFAGPMEAAAALRFRRAWRSPAAALRSRADAAKGLEAAGRTLAEQLQVGWKEYWPFLDTFTDLRSTEGLTLLEKYLKSKYDNACSVAYSDSFIEAPAEDLSLSKISLRNVSTPIKDTNLSPMSELCVAMKTCTISSDRQVHWRKTDPIRQRLCRQPIVKPAQNLVNFEINSPINHTVSPILCIERTLQVFAKRIADALIFSLNAEPEVAGDGLKSESKHLQHTIYTYMDDERFKSLDFSLIHSRLAQIVVYKLNNQLKEINDINSLVEFLIKLRCPNDDIFSSDDERKTNYRVSNKVSMNHVIDLHVRCLSSFISEELPENDTSKGPALGENECKDLWQRASKCCCEWKVEYYERNSKRNASFRKNRSLLSTSPKMESFVKRLIFDQDIGDNISNGELSPTQESNLSTGNSPAGDAPALVTVQMDKCQVISAEMISDDESDNSSGEEVFQTASEHSDSDESMKDADETAIVEVFIYGEEPSKDDRLVYDALADCTISAEQYPHVCRWRHNVALYSPSQRDKWAHVSMSEDSVADGSVRLGSPQRPTNNSSLDNSARCPSLQVSSWLRVTGPHSPRSALASKNIGHNVSFGF